MRSLVLFSNDLRLNDNDAIGRVDVAFLDDRQVIVSYMEFDGDYAFLKVNESGVESIQEKVPFTEDKTQELASTGGYYFKSGNLAKEYIIKVFQENLLVNNEVYISTPYELMINDKLNINKNGILFLDKQLVSDINEYKFFIPLL